MATLRPSEVPDKVGKLAAANRTLVSSLEQAHADLAAVLIERDTLQSEREAMEREIDELMASATSSAEDDLVATRRQLDALQASAQQASAARKKLQEKLKVALKK
jgi:chromosome segregation ATPase